MQERFAVKKTKNHTKNLFAVSAFPLCSFVSSVVQKSSRKHDFKGKLVRALILESFGQEHRSDRKGIRIQLGVIPVIPVLLSKESLSRSLAARN